MADILVTGFEPFGGERVNPSAQVALSLGGRFLAGGVRVEAAVLPCRFGAALTDLDAALTQHRPALVLCLGQAQGRSDLSLERLAVNLDDARIPDNAGAQPVDRPIEPGGPAAYFTGLPVKAMVAGLHAAGWPASVSNTAGTFVCNHVFYGLMHRLAVQPGVRGGFMHLPLSAEQAVAHPGQLGWPLAWMAQGVWRALELAWSHAGADLALAGEGRLD